MAGGEGFWIQNFGVPAVMDIPENDSFLPISFFFFFAEDRRECRAKGKEDS